MENSTSFRSGISRGLRRLPAELGALVLKALDAAIADIPLPEGAKDVSAATFSVDRPTISTLRADALGVLAESFLKHGAEALNGGERHHIVVHVDAEALQARGAGRCEHEDGPALPVETARRLACDASIVRIVEDAQGEPLDVGRKTRSIPPALRRALKSRDQGCVFPGCTHQRYVDGHHIQHWAEGGATKLSNLVSLCRAHHRAVHEGGVVIQRLDDGAWRFIKRSGEVLEACVPGRTRPLAQWTQIVAAHEAQGLEIDARTATTGWRGETMDYGMAIDLLIAGARRAGTLPRKRPEMQRQEIQRQSIS